MPTLRIPPGVVRGESKASVPGRWYDVNLVRWSQGNMLPVGGWERTTQTPLGSVPRGAHVWLDLDGNRHMGVVCDAKVFRQDPDNAYHDITPPGFADANTSSSRGYGSGLYGIKNFGSDAEDRGSGLGALDPKHPIRFCADNWADELLFLSSADGRVFVWDPKNPNTAPHVAENAPTLVQAMLVTDEHHLMVFKGNQVSWSDQNNRTGWDFTNVTGQAGNYDLEGAGQIITAMKIPGGILAFTQSSVWLGRYIGQPYYYGWNKLSEGQTPVSAQAVVVAGSRAFWPGKRNFWKFEGGVVTTLPCTLGSTPFTEWDANAAPRRVTGGFNGAFPEVWWYYPSAGQGLEPALTENDRYVAYNFDENWWTDGYQARSLYVNSPLDGGPIAAHPGGWMYQHEIGFLDEGQPRTNRVWAEVGALSFDDGASNWTVNQCQIDSAQGPQSVRFSFRGRRTRGGPEAVLQTGLIPRADGFLDTHFTARDFTMRVEGLVDAPWALGAFIFHDIKKRNR